MADLSHTAAHVRVQNRDRFLQALFVPESAREGLLTLYALETELASIRKNVREEMIAYIRYAWWSENLAALYEGNIRQGHPILEALAPLCTHIPKEKLLAMIDPHRASWPEVAIEGKAVTDEAAQALVHAIAPDAEKRLKRAGEIIEKHREKHAKGAYARLVLRLLFKI